MKFKYLKFPEADPSKPFIGRPLVPVYLHGENISTESPYFALVDSGADYVLFPADLAIAVGIEDINTGEKGEIVGIAGQKAAVYYHNLELQIQGSDRKLPVEVGFSKEIYMPVLGRSFFRHFRSVNFSEQQEEVELRV